MLTRLRVSGFKNLIDIDISFGPFTCIAGANGVGKSNLLDAILFLSKLSDRPLIEAALSVRDQGARTGDIRGLFHHVGEHFDEDMKFEAEMIIPERGTDDLGQEAIASSTFVQYAVSLRYKRDEGSLATGSLELVREELTSITPGEATHHLPFAPSTAWRNKFVTNRGSPPKYISTEGTGSNRVINVHQDGGSSGKPQKLRAANLPRTVLSAANSAASPTATLVKREMQSWRLLQLEPSALREPDNFTAPAELASDGAHLPAAMYHLANSANGSRGDSAAVYAELANRVSELLDDVRSVYVDRDERRQLLTVHVGGRDGTTYPARDLSDGTLRFLALAVLSIEPGSRGVICMEEPENGIHPERIPAMIHLLRDLSTDIDDKEEADPVNGLRQVIINTHSPSVVMQVPDDSLVMAEPIEITRNALSFRALQLRCLPGTWRDKTASMSPLSKGRLLAYLNPVAREPRQSRTSHESVNQDNQDGSRRVIDRPDIMQYKMDFSEIVK